MYDISRVWKDWKTEELLGEGSFGKVYSIVREQFGITEHSALKVISIPGSSAEINTLRNEGMDDESVTTYYRSLADSFVHEIALMAKLKGEANIVSYEDYQVLRHDDGIGWDILIRMELLKPLSQTLREKTPTERDVIELGIGLCDALTVCHQQGIIHRDIKIDNIFVSENGVYKLGDFGVARVLEGTSGELSKKGTYTYMAPEVYRGENYGKTVDIYSLGMVMYRLMNNNREPFMPQPPQPITVTDKNGALVRRMNGEPLPAPANASAGLCGIILRACAYRAEDRYASAEQLRHDLNLLLRSGAQTPAPRPAAPEAVPTVENHAVAGADSDRLRNERKDYAPVGAARADGGEQKPKKKKRLWLIVIPIALAAIGVVAFILFNNSPKSSQSKSTSTSSDTSQDDVTQSATDSEDVSSQDADLGSFVYRGVAVVDSQADLDAFCNIEDSTEGVKLIAADCVLSKDDAYQITYNGSTYYPVHVSSSMDVSGILDRRADLIFYTMKLGNETVLELVNTAGYETQISDFDDAMDVYNRDEHGETVRAKEAKIYYNANNGKYWLHMKDATVNFSIISDTVRLSDYDGKTVDLRFFATDGDPQTGDNDWYVYRIENEY